MAQTLFEAFSGTGVTMDNETVLTVQSLVESHDGSTLDFVADNVDCTIQEEDDVFQCGKCKGKFISLPEFIMHKKTHYTDFQIEETESGADLEQVTNYVELKDVDNSEPDMSQPIILNDSDILSFSIEQTGLDVNSPTQVLPSLESSESYLTTGTKTMDIENGDNNPFQMDAFENQIIIATQMPPNCILPEDEIDKQDMQFTSQEELGYLNPDCLLTSVDKDLGETVTVSVLRVMQDVPLTEELVTNELDKRSDKTTTLLKCLHCGKLFSKNFDLQQHVRSHTGERPYQCVVCGRAFTQKSNVKKHMATHKVWPNQLRTMFLEEKEPKNVNQGQSESDSISNFYHCQFCTAVFLSFKELLGHRKQHKHQKVYKCIQKNCNETFEDLDLFLEHIHVHADEAEYHCHLCNKEFGSLDDLGTHQYEHGIHPKPSNKSVTCKKCKSKFSNMETLEKHLAMDSHNYSCPKCQKVFSCERFLRRHLPIHATVPTHVCGHCGKRFKTEQYLNIHKVIHSDDKPYVCKICSMAFNRQDKLTRHNLIHDPVKKFKCPFSNHLGCEKEFNRKDKLQQHIITHSSSMKDLNCKRCRRGFKKHCQLKQHEKACLTRDISCKVCGHKANDLARNEKTPHHSSKTKVIKRNCRNIRSKENKTSKIDDQDGVPTLEIVVVPMSGGKEENDEEGVYRVIMPSDSKDSLSLTQER